MNLRATFNFTILWLISWFGAKRDREEVVTRLLTPGLGGVLFLFDWQ